MSWCANRISQLAWNDSKFDKQSHIMLIHYFPQFIRVLYHSSKIILRIIDMYDYFYSFLKAPTHPYLTNTFTVLISKHGHGLCIQTFLNGKSMRLVFLSSPLRNWGVVSLGTLRSSSPRRCLIGSIAIVIEKLFGSFNMLLGKNAYPMITCHQHYLSKPAKDHEENYEFQI